MTDLRLIALDAEDLAIISAHLQDAVVRVGDMTFLPREKRFVAMASRFDWSAALGGGSGETKRAGLAGAAARYRRRQTAIRFDRVLAAKVSGIDLKAKRQVLALLSIHFEPRAADDPGGSVTLVFAANAAIRLEIECIEAELRDLGAVWATRSRPRHGGDEGEGTA
jgi:hypothetical protein